MAAIESTATSDTCGTINYATGEVQCFDGDTVIFSMERVADQANTSEKVPELLKASIMALLDNSELDVPEAWCETYHGLASACSWNVSWKRAIVEVNSHHTGN